MNAELGAQLGQLLRMRTTAALGTLRAAAPYVSMVPYAMPADGSGFIVHVSTLAAHTKDMLADARVSLLVAEAEGGAHSALGLMRLTVQGLAGQLRAEDARLAECSAAYLARFPDAEPMFGFADFSIFLIRPESARFVAGFGQAHSLSGESLVKILQGKS
ncbi:MAG: pyridoxamine 5'-phosphate oxidase family protein [Burkholderiales bacterium]|nr:pyridoxamine 5'-phosphate oxidase family protein [Burkholderiales bacterium]